jgi:hypothetical protein
MKHIYRPISLNEVTFLSPPRLIKTFAATMKYSIVYLGLATLSSVTHSALISPLNTKDVDNVVQSSAPKTAGPEFPVKVKA